MTVGPVFEQKDPWPDSHINAHFPVKAETSHEFPGLERNAQETFGLPYAELTPNLQAVVRKVTKEDAAEDLLAFAQKITKVLAKNPQGRGLRVKRYERELEIQEAWEEGCAVIAKAEGRQ